MNTSDIATRRTIVRPLHIWGSWEMSGAYICTSLGFKGLRITLIKDIQMNKSKNVIMKGKENQKNENEKKNMNQKIKKKLSMMNLMK